MMNIPSGDLGPLPGVQICGYVSAAGFTASAADRESPSECWLRRGFSVRAKFRCLSEAAINFLLTFVLKSAKLGPVTIKEGFA